MRRPFLMAAAVALLSGCGLIGFDEQKTGDATVPGGGITGTLLGALPAFGGLSTFDLTQNEDFQKNKGLVSSVKLTSLTMQISAPNTQDYSFLDTVDFFVASDGGTPVEVAHQENISTLGLAAPNPTLTFQLDDVELKPYVEGSTTTLTTTAGGRQPPQDTTLHLVAKFHISI